jgi:Sporulation and spore germination
MILAALLLAACRGDSVTILSEQDLPEDVYGSPLRTPTPSVDLPEEGTVYLIREGRLVERRLPLQGEIESLPGALLVALFTAPVEGKRVHSAIPPGTTLNAVTVDGPVATVDVTSTFEAQPSERSLALRVAQVVYTLTQQGLGIVSVQFVIDGQQTSVTGGGGEPLFRPVFRQDYSQFGPLEPS